MLLTMEKVLFLRRVPIFSMLEGEEIHHIADLAEEVTYPGGTLIIREHDRGDALYVIVTGRVRLSKEQSAETLALLQPADYFGETAILDGNPHTAAAQAMGDVVVLRLSARDFRLSIEENPAIAFGVFKVLLQRLRREEEDGPREPVAVTAPAPAP